MGASPPSALLYNRHTNNNAVNYVDPTGHYACKDLDCVVDTTSRPEPRKLLSSDTRKYNLSNFAKTLHGSDNYSDVNTLSSSSDFAARQSNNQTDIFMEDMNAVFGHKDDGVETFIPPATTDIRVAFSTYGLFQSDGFALAFQDPDSDNDQVHHFWYHVQLSYYHGMGAGMVANVYHETWPTESGKSMQDYLLGAAGTALGTNLRWGTIKPSGVGRWIENELSESPYDFLFNE